MSVLNAKSFVENQRQCNCRKPESCPLENKCLSSCLVYKATVSTNVHEKYYYGIVEGQFKERWSNHRKSFKHPRYEHDTALSTYVWSLKNKNEDHSIKWEIAKKSNPYSPGSKVCNLCTEEKLCILEGDPEVMLNEKSEIISKCRHRSKFILRNTDYGWLSDITIEEKFQRLEISFFLNFTFIWWFLRWNSL